MASVEPCPPAAAGGDAQAEPGAEWRWFLVRLCAFMVLLLLVVPGGNPVASDREGREKAGPFVEKLYPGRPVTPADSPTAPVAVVLHLIRSGEPGVARRAIDFAA